MCVCGVFVYVTSFFFLNKNTIFFSLAFFRFLPSMPGLCSTSACTSPVLDQYKRWWRRYQTFFYETSTEGHTGSCCFSTIRVATVNPEDFQIRSWGGGCVSFFRRYQQFPSLLPRCLLLCWGISIRLQKEEFLNPGWK